MTVSLDQWRAMIGTFNCGSSFSINSHTISLTESFICFVLICLLPNVFKHTLTQQLTIIWSKQKVVILNTEITLNNVRRGRVYICYKEPIPALVINLPYFNEPLLLAMNHNNIEMILLVIYSSPGQNYIEFDLFLSNFEKLVIDIKSFNSHLPNAR